MTRKFSLQACDREILAQRLAWCALCRWYVLNCEPEFRAHNREGYRQQLRLTRKWRIDARVTLGGGAHR